MSRRRRYLVKYLDYEITLALLLAAYDLGQKKFNELVQLLEKFMFRYKGICNNKHQILGDIFMKEAVKIRENKTRYRLNDLKAKLRELINSEAGDQVFRERIKSLKYVDRGNNKLIKYLFATLNEYSVWYTNGATGKPKAEQGVIINYDEVSIEHIFSQNPEDGSVPGFDINELRNLTILTITENGDRVKNKSYPQKREVYISSNYQINKWFQNYDSWDETAMNTWLSCVQDLACKVFAV